MATRQKTKELAGSAKASLDAGTNAALAGKEALAAGKEVLAGTRAAGKAVSAATSRARLPLIAGGSLIAGLSGGLAVIKHHRG